MSAGYSEDRLFLEKIQHNDVDGVAKILKKKPYLMSAKNANCDGVLHHAAAFDAAEIIHCLAKHGLDINQVNGAGNSALALAVHGKRSKAVEALLECGADPSLKNEVSHSPLFMAANNNDLLCAKALIHHGADLKELSATGPWGWGQVPLHAASYNGHVEMVSLLIEAGVDVKRVDNQGRSALYYAISAHLMLNEEGILKTVDTLMSGGAQWNEGRAVDMSEEGGNGEGDLQDAQYSPFHLASESGLIKVVGYFIDQVTDLKGKSKWLNVAISSAKRRGQLKSVDLYQGQLLAIEEQFELQQCLSVDGTLQESGGSQSEKKCKS